MTQRPATVRAGSYESRDALELRGRRPARSGREQATAEEFRLGLDDRNDAVVVVPQSHGFTGLKIQEAVEHTRLAVVWARELFGAGPVTLVGLGTGADAALAFSLGYPDQCGRVWIDADGLLSEIKPFDAEHVSPLLGDRPNDLPYVLASRLLAPDRRRTLASVFADKGFRFETPGFGDEAKPGTLCWNGWEPGTDVRHHSRPWQE